MRLHRFRTAGGDRYLAALEFSDPVKARVLTAYGSSTQRDSPHRGDRLVLFARQEIRPVWRKRSEIEANLETREILPRR
jgi:acyl-homoserine-lactone acylase